MKKIIITGLLPVFLVLFSGCSFWIEDNRDYKRLDDAVKISEHIEVRPEMLPYRGNEYKKYHDFYQFAVYATDCSEKKHDYNRYILIKNLYIMDESGKRINFLSKNSRPVKIGFYDTGCKCLCEDDIQTINNKQFSASYIFEKPMIPFNEGDKIAVLIDMVLMPEGISKNIELSYSGTRNRKLRYQWIRRP